MFNDKRGQNCSKYMKEIEDHLSWFSKMTAAQSSEYSGPRSVQAAHSGSFYTESFYCKGDYSSRLQILLSPLEFHLPSCINTYLIILLPNSSAAKPCTPETSLSSLLSSGFIIRILSSEVYSEMPINKLWPCPVKLVLWIRS